MHRLRSVAAMALVLGCTSKRVVPDDTATNSTGMGESATAMTGPAVSTSGIVGGSSGSGSSESTGWGTGGVVPPFEVTCEGLTCAPGELCVIPGKICVHYDSEGCDPNDGFDDPCADDEPGDPPFCAPPPASCAGVPWYEECVGETLCNQLWDCNESRPVDGVVDCGPYFCHCP